VALLAISLTLLLLVDLMTGWTLRRVLADWRDRGQQRGRLVVVHGVLGHLRAITAMNLPLSPAVQAASAGEERIVGRAMRDVGHWLSLSLPVSEAMRRALPGCPRMVTGMIASGEQAGQLPAALVHLDDWLADRLHSRTPQMPNFWVYPITVLCFTAMMTTGIMIVVVPKFKKILEDFDMRMPKATEHLIAAAQWFVAGSPPGWAIALGISIVIATGIMIGRRIGKTSTGPNRAIIDDLTDRIKWRIPVYGRLVFSEEMANRMNVLGMGLRSGMTLERAIRLAADTDGSVCVKERFGRLAQLLTEGAPPSDAARQVQLGPVFEYAIGMISRGEDPQNACQYAAQSHQAIAKRLLAVLGQAVEPAMTLLTSLVVAYVVFSLFVPLVTLIEGTLSNW
jgi:type IV pilus assembly protein PilC